MALSSSPLLNRHTWSTVGAVRETVRALAHEINARRRQELDDKALDQVHQENQKLDEFKNRFLPSFGEGDGGDGDGNGEGRRKRTRDGQPVEWGTEPEILNYEVPKQGLQIGKGISVGVRAILGVNVRDRKGRP